MFRKAIEGLLCAALCPALCGGCVGEPTAADIAEMDEALGRGITIVPCATNDDCVGASRNPCNFGRCINHVCSYTIVPPPGSTAACDDGSICTFNDHCSLGRCVGDPSLVLLSGTQLPWDENWNMWGNTFATSVVGNHVVINTAAMGPQEYNTYTYQSPIANWPITHDLEWHMIIHASDVAYSNGGAAVLPDLYEATGLVFPDERLQMVMYTPTEVRWGDNSASYVVNTSVDHFYQLHDNGGGLELWVDGTLALSRPSYQLNASHFGFGDQSAIYGLNGHFEIWDMRLTARSDCQ